MKRLIDDERTADLLKQWAGGSEVIVLEHFFWIAGTQLQKSHQGILQSLLCQLLKVDPRLVQLTLTRRWRSPQAFSRPWSVQELTDALGKAIGNSDKPHLLLCGWAARI
jgi:hypothetical protein